MILISHRGNIDSIIIKRENTQSYIQDAIDLGYDVEIDVWYVDFLVHKSSPFWLGHDEPQCEVEVDWLFLADHTSVPAAADSINISRISKSISNEIYSLIIEVNSASASTL